MTGVQTCALPIYFGPKHVVRDLSLQVRRGDNTFYTTLKLGNGEN